MSMVGNKAGRRKILWGPLLKMVLAVVPLATGASSLAYFALTRGGWNPMAAWLGLATGFAIVLVLLIVNLFSPVNRLPFVR